MNDLRQIRPFHRRAEFDLPLTRLLAQQDLQERCLSGAVVAQQRNALTAAHLQIDAGKQRSAVELLGEVFDGQNLVAEEIALVEARAHGLVPGGLVRFFDALHAVLDGHGAAVECAVVDTPTLHALERKAELAKLGLLLLVLLELKLEARLLFLHIERIIAAIELRLAVVDLHDAADDAVEKIPVVRDGQDGALELLDVVLEPLHAVHIEVVRRLVEQQDVRPFQQQPRQIDARLFSAGEACKLLPALRGGDGKAVADLVRLRVGLVAAALKRFISSS